MKNGCSCDCVDLGVMVVEMIRTADDILQVAEEMGIDEETSELLMDRLTELHEQIHGLDRRFGGLWPIWGNDMTAITDNIQSAVSAIEEGLWRTPELLFSTLSDIFERAEKIKRDILSTCA
jgi:hypothetical protein